MEEQPEVLVFGDDRGTSQVCVELGVRHIPGVATNEFGRPLISDMFARAQQLATHDILCYVNADVILTAESASAARRVAGWSSRFLMVAQRWDIDTVEPAELDDPNWETNLKTRAFREGERKSEVWIDWFVFPRGQFDSIPPFAVGRPGWDNWLIWHSVTSGVPVIDATSHVPLIHQRHDYSQSGGQKVQWEGDETKQSRALVGHWSHYYTVAHAQWMLTPLGEIVAARGWKYRLAKPRRLVSHSLRFTRPLRRRLLEARSVRRTAG
ncbi:MAG TPA: hypothetical protein VNV65_02395 [Candidatus Solibacter sp.]|nr:hypothetical protein [Candidatus Solibacter sp.]